MPDRMAEARKFAEWALSSRLVDAKADASFGHAKRLDTLKARIARIRAGNGDDLLEVQSAFLALTHAPTPTSQDTDR